MTDMSRMTLIELEEMLDILNLRLELEEDELDVAWTKAQIEYCEEMIKSEKRK